MVASIPAALNDDALLRKPAACAFLAISGPTLDRWVRAGRLPRVKLGERTSAYRVADLRAFVQGSMQSPPSTAEALA